MEKIRFGANYIPSKNWLFSWNDWDSAAVEEDLLAAKEIGVDHIRANLLWHYFQLNPTAMSPVCMRNLEDFVRICEKVDMDFCITLFTGFMSGFHFLPAWSKNLGGGFFKGIFYNEKMMAAEEFYIREISKVVSDSPNFIGFDLGNELSCVTIQDKEATIDLCDAWHKRMLGICEELAPGKLHNNGVDHRPWFENNCFSREVLTNTGTITPLHCYSLFTGALGRFGRLSEESIHLAPFMAEVAKAHCNDKNRKYWVQEFGTADANFNDEMETFIVKSMEAMYTTENLWGITWWCTNNVSSDYNAFDPLEYSLGLLDVNNKITPSGKCFKELVASYKSGSYTPPKRTKAILLQSEDTIGTYNPTIAWDAGHRYAECIRAGIYPQIILPQYEHDKEYLKSRGIDEIIK